LLGLEALLKLTNPIIWKLNDVSIAVAQTQLKNAAFTPFIQALAHFKPHFYGPPPTLKPSFFAVGGLRWTWLGWPAERCSGA
jgi:hypothetical protein